MRRQAAAALVAGLWLIVTGPAAGAHGNLRASDPADGSAVEQPPQGLPATAGQQAGAAPEP